MADPIDDLVLRWKQNPNSAATIALCDALRGSTRATLVMQIGQFATQRHASDVGVMLAVARMYLDAQRLAEAQSVLVGAGKLAPREGQVYRWLGEVLLRRGDAERAEKVLERAIQLGAKDPEARLWLERARVFRPMQAKAGARTVAAEVARAATMQAPAPGPARPAMDSFSDTTTMVRDMPPIDDLAVTRQRPPSASASSLAAAESGVLPPAQRVPLPPMRAAADSESNLDTHVFEPPARAQIAAAAAAAGFPKPIPAAGAPAYAKDIDTAPAFTPLTPPPTLQRPPSVDVEFSVQASIPAETPPPRARSDRPPPVAAPPPRVRSDRPPPLAAPPLRPLLDSTVADEGSPFAAPPPKPAPAARAPQVDASGPAMTPHPRDVLDALALAGVFEPPATSGMAAGWDRAQKQQTRKLGTVMLAIATVVLVGGGIGTFMYVKKVRARQHDEAEALLAQVENDLHAAKPATLEGSEKSMFKVFLELESRSPRASIDWLHERALVGLVKGTTDVAFEDGMERARQVGIKEEDLAFARVASALFQNDVSGALDLVPKWDGTPAAKDPWYQLITGATLERAGDARARERYAAAAQLDPAMLLAQEQIARWEAVDGDPQKAAELAKTFRAAHPDRAEGAALVALAWGRDPGRSEQAPPEVDETVQRAADLPATLAFVPHAVRALRAIDKRDWDEAKDGISKALAAAGSPGIATWIGTIALATGDEALSRKAALRAVSFSAIYPPARILAARVALLGNRLDEALKATEELDPGAPNVAIVRGAVAYERLDADGLARAIGALPPDAQKLPFLASLGAGADVMQGRAQIPSAKLLDLADDDAPWSDLVAMDAALDQGDLDTAGKIAESWKGTEDRPLRALRLARFARYQKRLDDAEKLSAEALANGTVTSRGVVERVLVLVARGQSADVPALIGRYPTALGPLATWLSAYAIAAGGKPDDAKAKTAAIDVLPPGAPLLARDVVAVALGAMKDKKRGLDYVTPLVSAAQNPDVVAAALSLGFKEVPRPGGKVSYEPPPF